MSHISSSQNFILGLNPLGFHRMFYTTWGNPNNPTVFCIHGLTRNHHDFDLLAHRLAHDFFVVCPDIVGRGKSDHLQNAALYNYPQYLADLNALIARINTQKIMWIGTSMGGLLGMMLASMPKSPIQKIILNDIGPIIPLKGLQRIGHYAPHATSFSSFDDAMHFFQQTLSGYGRNLRPEIWRELTMHSVWHNAHDHRWHLAYDPQIASTFIAPLAPLDFSNYWKNVDQPCLVLRGAFSDLLPRDVFQAMSQKNNVTVNEIPDAGHAPSLMEDAQIQLIYQWLKA